MSFFTFGRANWLAGLVVLLGLFLIYPRRLVKFAAIVVPVVLLILASGIAAPQIEKAQKRFLSDQSAESALSRLPVVYASIRMFEARPVTGWGYGNFDLYDRQFQTAIDGVIVPEKDHASHNLYLTIMAEQGTVGILLYLGPALAVYLLSRMRRRSFPREGFVSQKLLSVLGICLVAHVVVNNFANMRIVYGLGFWWLTLGLLASLVDQARPAQTGQPVLNTTARIPMEGLIARSSGAR
jgi:O-antigen ligase